MAEGYPDSDLLLLSGIQHFAFCRRQWALIHIEQQWQENVLTFNGREMHQRVDDPFFTETRQAVVVTRSLPLVSRVLGLYGVADVVEFHRDDNGISLSERSGRWLPYPVEYKYGQTKSDDRDLVQLGAQGLCLEEMFGVTVAAGALFYGRTRRRQTVEFDAALRDRVRELAAAMHELFERGVTPAPKSTAACKNCSLVAICLPQMNARRSVRRYLAERLRDND